MSKYKCPRCGHNEFFANNFIEWYTVEVDANGDFVGHVSLDDSGFSEQSEIWCAKCDYVGKWTEFEEEADGQRSRIDLIEARKNAYRRHGTPGVPTAHVYD